jgi:nucleoside-diphosphate-sugar epimerase
VPTNEKVVVTGAAGLVGQNLIARLKRRGGFKIVAIDKHPSNTRLLRELHPDITVIEADMAVAGDWSAAFSGSRSVVIAHAQIGGLDRDDFNRNNVTATRNLLAALGSCHADCHLVHISSSVVNSAAVDWYTESKKQQEEMVLAAGYPVVVLRPTLMFGWFDRKHLGWLGRFMRRVPIFPVPGSGRYRRQPLYAGDFCDIIIACLERHICDATYNISGLETIDYIDLIRLVRDMTGASARIINVPYGLFRTMLATYSLFDRNPPFTTGQLAALVIPEIFEVIEWPTIFSVRSTPLREAVKETFCDPRYSSIVLEF